MFAARKKNKIYPTPSSFSQRRPAPSPQAFKAPAPVENLSRFMRSGGAAIQPKLKVGPANDSFEHEADRAADSVMGGSTVSAVTALPAVSIRTQEEEEPMAKRLQRQEEEEVQSKVQRQEDEDVQSKIQRQEEEEEELQTAIQRQEEEEAQTKLQRQEEEEEAQPKLQRQEEEEAQPKLQLQEEEEAQPKLQRQEEEEGVQAFSLQRQEEEEAQTKVQRQEEEEAQTKSLGPANGTVYRKVTDEGDMASPDVEVRLRESKGRGQPLPEAVQMRMGSFFKADFSAVRIHTDSRAHQLSMELNAQAFTHGRDIYFNRGFYDPNSARGQRVLAHELTHVIQQGAAPRTNTQRKTTKAPAANKADPTIQRIPFGDKIDEYAQGIPGWKLVTVIIGYNPLTNKSVARTPGNLIGGYLALIPGMGYLINQLEKSGALTETFNWLQGRIGELGITLSSLKSLISEAWDQMSLIRGFSYNFNILKNTFGPMIRRILRFGRDLVVKIKEFVFKGALKLVGAPVNLIMGVINKGADVLNKIISDPVGFLKNLLKAVTGGIGLFFKNIVSHLKKGIMGWLLGSLEGLDIQLPEKFDLAGIFSLIAQILGLTYQRIRAKVVKKLGPKGEKIISAMEKTVTLVKDIITKGPIALWDFIKEGLSNIKSMVLGAIRNWVIVTIVKQAVLKLASMFNPVGAIIQAIVMVYDVIMFLWERIQQIAEFVKSIFEAIAEIASGVLGKAMKAVENALSRTVPIIISFMASLIGLGGITAKIQAIIKKIRKPVDAAIDKVVGFLVKKGKALLKKGKAAAKKGAKAVAGKVGSLLQWWKKKVSFKAGKKSHKIYFEGNRVMMASTPTEVGAKLKALKALISEKEKEDRGGDLGKILTAYGQVQESYGVIRSQQAAARKLLEKKPNKLTAAEKKQMEEARSQFDAKNKEGLPARMGALLEALEGEAGPLVPQTVISNIRKTSLGGTVALEVHAKPLSIVPGSPAGSAPEPSISGQSVEPYKTLSYRRSSGGKRPYYVAGHFISNALHGPGKDYNLAPMDGGGNRNFESSVESEAKKVVWNKDQKEPSAAAFYTVSATAVGASNSPSSSDIDQRFDPDTTIEDGPLAGSSKREVAKKIVEYEKGLPRTLTSSITKMKKEGDNWIVTSEQLATLPAVDLTIPETVPDFSGAPVNPETVVENHLTSKVIAAPSDALEKSGYSFIGPQTNQGIAREVKLQDKKVRAAINALISDRKLVKEKAGWYVKSS